MRTGSILAIDLAWRGAFSLTFQRAMTQPDIGTVPFIVPMQRFAPTVPFPDGQFVFRFQGADKNLSQVETHNVYVLPRYFLRYGTDDPLQRALARVGTLLRFWPKPLRLTFLSNQLVVNVPCRWLKLVGRRVLRAVPARLLAAPPRGCHLAKDVL